jgi:opacity protein-like surface antigen
MKKIAIAVLALMAIGAQAAGMSNEDGVYVGLTGNSTKLSCDDCTGSAQTSVGIYGGYRMGNISAEVARYQKTDDVGVKVVITDFAAIPRLNVAKDVDLLGKVGIRHGEISNDIEKFTGNSLVIGAGVEYTVMPQVTARAMFDYSNKTFGESVKTKTMTVGVAYKF